MLSNGMCISWVAIIQSTAASSSREFQSISLGLGKSSVVAAQLALETLGLSGEQSVQEPSGLLICFSA